MKEFLAIQEITQLKQLGDLNILREKFQSLLPPHTKINVNSYEELMDSIKWIQKNYIDTDSTFTTKKKEYIYYLLEHSNGKERKKKLQVEDNFTTKEGLSAAKKWYKKIALILRADIDKDPRARDAFEKLKDMMRELTKLEVDEVDFEDQSYDR